MAVDGRSKILDRRETEMLLVAFKPLNQHRSADSSNFLLPARNLQ